MEQHLILDWEKIHLYNSLMALVAGVAFMSIWSLITTLNSKKEFNPIGVSLNFAVVGIILFITGVHTTLTWPLAPTYPFDNSIFGEPCFVFGSILLALSFYFWKGRNSLTAVERDKLNETIIKEIFPMQYMIMGIGFTVIVMGMAGIHYRIFIAPPEEPIVSELLELIPNFTSYVIGLSWISVGIAAIGFVYYMRSIVNHKKGNFKWLFQLLLFLGISFMGTGVVTYYTHVGFEINTMAPDTIKPNVINKPDTTYHKSPYINPN